MYVCIKKIVVNDPKVYGKLLLFNNNKITKNGRRRN